MKFWATYTRVLGYSWLALTGILIMGGVVMSWMKGGHSGVQALLSPNNVVNWIAMAIVVAPGFVLLKLSEKLKNKIKET